MEPLLCRLRKRLLTFCTNQLCITLISWPLLIYWGLPVAFLSPIGNLIFSPFLSLFLFLSLVVSGTELIGVPNGIFTQGLDLLVNVWLGLISLAPESWTLSCARPPLYLVIIPTLAAIFIMHYKRLNTMRKKLLALFVVALVVPFIFIYLPRSSDKVEIELVGQKSFIIQKNNELTLIVPHLTRSCNWDQWIDYTLRPCLAKGFGRETLDICVFSSLTPSAVYLVKILCKKKAVRHLFLPHTPSVLREELKEVAKKESISVGLASLPFSLASL